MVALTRLVLLRLVALIPNLRYCASCHAGAKRHRVESPGMRAMFGLGMGTDTSQTNDQADGILPVAPPQLPLMSTPAADRILVTMQMLDSVRASRILCFLELVYCMCFRLALGLLHIRPKIWC